jgi:hypothetical protein
MGRNFLLYRRNNFLYCPLECLYEWKIDFVLCHWPGKVGLELATLTDKKELAKKELLPEQKFT